MVKKRRHLHSSFVSAIPVDLDGGGVSGTEEEEESAMT